VIVQRRCLRTTRAINAGETLTREMIDVLRPATQGAILPYEISSVLGKKLIKDKASGEELRWLDLSD
jgi:N-acetylneuraminate synthase